MDEPVRIFSTVSRLNGSSGTYRRARQWRWDLIHATANISYATLTHIQGVPAASLVGSMIALAVILIFGTAHLSRTQSRQVDR